MDGLKIKRVKIKEMGLDFRTLTRDHLPIKVRNLFPETELPFDLYFPYILPSKRLSLDKTHRRGEIYRRDFHENLLKNDVSIAYIKKTDQDEFLDYFGHHLSRLLKDDSVPTDVKTRLLYDDAETIVKKVFRERPSQSNIRLGRRLVDNWVTHLKHDTMAGEALMAIFSKDYYTFSHCVQVALLGMLFCKHLGWSEAEIKDFGLGALFHDVGKIGIDDSILNKPARLDDDEFEIIKRHPSIGYEQIRKTQVLSRKQLEVILRHHEAMDGTGYPDGLSGKKIPKYARIARIIDCYDALTTNRSYKEALTIPKAVKIMTDEMGATFDRSYLEQFLEFLGLDRQADQLKRDQFRISLGVKVLIDCIDCKEQEISFKGIVVGMEAPHYLILRVADLGTLHKSLGQGTWLNGRYICEGNVYQFRTIVAGHSLYPIKLLFLVYPQSYRLMNLRKDPRVECFLPCSIAIDDQDHQGIILDLSLGGCKIKMRQNESGPGPRPRQDAPVDVKCHLWGESDEITLKGTIRHIYRDKEATTMGIQFDQQDHFTGQRLHRFLDEMLCMIR